MKHNRGKSSLLELLNANKAWELPLYRKPQFKAAVVNAAAALYGQANPSDPFATARMRLYLTQGYELPSEITSEARKAIRHVS